MNKTICLITFAFLLFIGTAHAQWSEIRIPGTVEYPANDVYGLCGDAAGNMYAAGTMLNSAGYYYVAKMTGYTWTELEGQDSLKATNAIFALCTDAAGNVYAAGLFTDSGFNTMGKCYVAKYNGTTWTSLGPIPGSNQTDYVICMCIDPAGNVYAAGKIIDTIAQHYYVAKYNGTSWSTLGGTYFHDQINVLYSDASGNIYAGGNFTNSSGKTYVAKYDGSAWSELGGANSLAGSGQISTIVGDGQNIYTAGQLFNQGICYVAKYDGNSWSQLPGSLGSDPNGGSIAALVLDHQNNLYAGGNFNDSFGGPTYISKYNGTGWNQYTNFIGAYYGEGVGAMGVDASGVVYAGGSFWDENHMQYFVVRFAASTGIDDMNQTSSISIYPNPSNNTITISAAENLSDATIRLTDITGQTVLEKNNQSGKAITLDIAAQPAGMYFISMQQQGSSRTGKVVKGN